MSAGIFANHKDQEFSYPTPCDKKYALGSFIGLGGGIFYTNATIVNQLRGPFQTLSINTPWFSFQYGTSNGINIYSLTFGPGYGFSVSQFTTTTWVTS